MFRARAARARAARNVRSASLALTGRAAAGGRVACGGVMRELHAMPRTRMRRVRRVALQDRTAEGSNHLLGSRRLSTATPRRYTCRTVINPSHCDMISGTHKAKPPADRPGLYTAMRVFYEQPQGWCVSMLAPAHDNAHAHAVSHEGHRRHEPCNRLGTRAPAARAPAARHGALVRESRSLVLAMKC